MTPKNSGFNVCFNLELSAFRIGKYIDCFQFGPQCGPNLKLKAWVL